jgi:hypothetical protein
LTGRPWVFLHKSGKAVESVGPEALVAIEPVHRLLHRLGGQPARDRAAGLFARDQSGVRQHIEVLHDRGQRHRERLRQLADRQAFAIAKPRQKRAPGRIGQRGEGAVQIAFLILNHTV